MARTRKGRPIDGWIVLDKPSGLGSTQAVAAVKRALNAAKVGHAGTLDPLASGVLPIALGAATKTVPYAMDATKRYRFTLRFGSARDTDDADGAEIASSAVRPGDAEIERALPAFRGLIQQVPPNYSAVKVAGERAYDLAREGVVLELAAREARIDRFALLERPDADTAVFEVTCGKGTYMRSLARDLAKALGTVGHVSVLRRLQVGGFTEEQAISLDKLPSPDQKTVGFDFLLPAWTALADIPALALTDGEAARLRNGQALSVLHLLGRIPAEVDPEGGLVRAMCGARIQAVARFEQGLLQPLRILAGS